MTPLSCCTSLTINTEQWDLQESSHSEREPSDAIEEVSIGIECKVFMRVLRLALRALAARAACISS